MSSEDDAKHVESSQEPPSDADAQQYSQPSSRRQSHTPGTPRKRRRIESVEPSRVRKYYLEGKYNDAYRVLFNQDVSGAMTRFEPGEGAQHYTTQYGASTWSGEEQAALFAALERLGRDNVPGIAQAVGTKTITETRELLLLLGDAAAKQEHVGLTLRDVPAAIELGQNCTEELDVMAEALAWYQEQFEVAQEQERYGDYWLITPAIAEDIEDAINGPVSRSTSTRPTTPAEPGTPHGQPGVAGACMRCKHHKIRCDRKVPCSSCARMKKKVVCEYKVKPIEPLNQDAHSDARAPQMPEVEQGEPDIAPPVAPTPQILQAIPQADLLHADTMLSLSKNLFMNRSPDLPSPWPHWSEYASEQVPEPSILRTAFNDFHTLVVSLTKRLMQTAVIQATSRLRSQRRRTKKGVMPFVKTRDVLSAIDILGLKRDGRARWTGVARRCNVRVFDEQRTTRFKTKQREVTWDQAEQILGLYDAVIAPSARDAYASELHTDQEDPEAFQRRAARSGTPLPMEHLSLSISESEAEIYDDEADMSEDVDPDVIRLVHPARDPSGRYTSVPPEGASQERMRNVQTLEQLDQEASRQEEDALCIMLGITHATKRKSPSDDGLESDDAGDVEKINTDADGWREWTVYQAVWEEHQSPIPAARFAANEKPRSSTPAIHVKQLRNARESQEDSDTSTSSRSPQRSRQKKQGVVELRARDPRAYAALQNNAYDTPDEPLGSDSSGSEDDLDADMPAQSVENNPIAQHINNSDTMDWEP